MLSSVNIHADHREHGGILAGYSGFDMNAVNPDVDKAFFSKRAPGASPLLISIFAAVNAARILAAVLSRIGRPFSN